MRVLLPLLIVAGLALPRAANACSSVPRCPITLPSSDVTLPANVPGFLVEIGGGTPPELIGPAGPVAADIHIAEGGWIVVPNAPLQPGTTYELHPNVAADSFCVAPPPSV